MPIETNFNFPSDLNASNPADGDARSTASIHLRGIKSVIKTTFPNVSAAVTPTHTQLNFVTGVTSAIQTQLNNRPTLDSGGASGARGRWVELLAPVDISGANYPITGLSSAYDEYEIVVSQLVPATNNTALWLRTSTNGTTYDSGVSDYNYITNAAGATAAQILVTSAVVSNTATDGGVNGSIRIYRPSVSARQGITYQGMSNNAGSVTAHTGAGVRLANTAIVAVQLLFSAGNITSGRVAVYARAK